MIGTTVSHYRILERLGGGGMGVVYLAEDTTLGRRVALKFLPPALASSPDSRERLLREARAASALNHPHICTIHEVGEQNGQPFIAMEWLDGETLKQRLEGGALPLDVLLDAAIQITEGLEAAHARGLIHRDLKPANLFITRRGDAKILDFGLAKSVDAAPEQNTFTGQGPLTSPGSTVGTVAYMAPEQARGEPVDARSDLFSLGLVLHEMATGRTAVPGGSTALAYDAILNRQFLGVSEINHNIPSSIDRVIRRLLSKAPTARHQSSRELRDELEAIRRERRGRDSSGSKAAPSIAVLPFANLSPDPENEYFADGMTEEVINTLGQIKALRVAARTSSFAFKGRTPDVSEVGEKLRVTTVLTGSVRKAGGRLRISVALVNATDGFQIWSERYDRQAEDVFAVQEEIAIAIAEHLKVALVSPSEPLVQRATDNLDAYQLYLKARFLMNQRGAGIGQGMALLREAVTLAPAYAPAHAALADAYALIGFYGYAPSYEVMPKARQSAQHALALNPALAEAHAPLVFVSWTYDWDFPRARREFDAVMALDPRMVTALIWWSLYLSAALGDFTQAIAVGERAIELDPLSATSYIAVSAVYLCAGRYPDAEANARRAAELNPALWLAGRGLGIALGLQGKHEEAIPILEAALTVSGGHNWMISTLCHSHAWAGHAAEARRYHDTLVAATSAGKYVQPMMQASTYAVVGELDAAFNWFERAYRERDPLPVLNFWPPYTAEFVADPRFAALMARVGLNRTAQSR
jgi:serine/threonine protein kinase/tetratricopeptide (TPR) repeat protein